MQQRSQDQGTLIANQLSELAKIINHLNDDISQKEAAKQNAGLAIEMLLLHSIRYADLRVTYANYNVNQPDERRASLQEAHDTYTTVVNILSHLNRTVSSDIQNKLSSTKLALSALSQHAMPSSPADFFGQKIQQTKQTINQLTAHIKSQSSTAEQESEATKYADQWLDLHTQLALFHYMQASQPNVAEEEKKSLLTQAYNLMNTLIKAYASLSKQVPQQLITDREEISKLLMLPQETATPSAQPSPVIRHDRFTASLAGNKTGYVRQLGPSSEDNATLQFTLNLASRLLKLGKIFNLKTSPSGTLLHVSSADYTSFLQSLQTAKKNKKAGYQFENVGDQQIIDAALDYFTTDLAIAKQQATLFHASASQPTQTMLAQPAITPQPSTRFPF